MELQKFIETSLREITAGLYNSNKEMIHSGSGKGISDSNYMSVEFDIAVTTTKEANGEVDGKVSVMNIFSLGGNSGQKDSLNNASRIKFSVLLRLNTSNEKYPVI